MTHDLMHELMQDVSWIAVAHHKKNGTVTMSFCD